MPIAARIVILSSGILLFVLIFELVRKNRFREELSIIWLIFSLIIASGSVIDIIIDPLARKLHIQYPPSFAFMLISIVFVVALLYFSLVTSDLKSKVKELTQQVALLEFTLNESNRKSTGDRH
ncbi:hypothetical protein BMS3Bbin06_00632 [bacterium BMS3Bbin06]|nr:hypothetical protein BMS3Abin08_01060 [bacterium BMS3Abin08]GBE34113.1 hypothetical protein BMS3Bbin06_00632 [bacterium BMS3Bbin06]HDY70492.1 DUF2304 domain-containing protein [Nitrospirota bacterium]